MRSRRLLLMLALALALPAAIGYAQLPIRLRTQEHTNTGNVGSSGGYGADVHGIRDFDGDGFFDYAVSAPSYPPFGSGLGRIYVYSGRTSEEITTLDGEQSYSGFGKSFDEIGDIDGDGTLDFVVGCPDFDTAAGRVGRIAAFSGSTGARLWFRDGSGAGMDLGLRMGLIADIDGDGKRDVVATEPRYGVFGSVHGRVLFLSGASGALLGTAEGPGILGDSLGKSLATRSDSAVVYTGSDHGRVYLVGLPVAGVASLTLFQAPVVNNGVSLALVRSASGATRLAIGRQLESTNGLLANGTCRLYGASPQPLLTIEGTRRHEFVGFRVAAIQDVNGDGEEEIAILSDADIGPVGSTRIRIFEQDGTLVQDEDSLLNSGDALSSIPDVSGDGRGEWISGEGIAARVGVWSVGLERTTFNAGPAGLFATFAVDMSAAHANRTYLQVFGLSGTTPGFPFPGGPHIPLNSDTFTTTAFQLIGTPLFPDALGTLDGAGTATTSVAIPGSISNLLSGFTLSTTVVILDPSGTQIAAVTNPRPARFP